MIENKDELARIITAENVSTAAGPVSAGAACPRKHGDCPVLAFSLFKNATQGC